jgi:hypothetical protein
LHYRHRITPALLPLLIALPAQALVDITDTPSGNPLLLQKNHFDAINPLLPTLNSSANSQNSYIDVIRAVDAAPDVAVFPIWVAGPVVASDTRHLLTKVAHAAIAGTISVIYPDIGEPYRSIFTQIINGIEETSKYRGVCRPACAKVTRWPVLAATNLSCCWKSSATM